MYDATKPASRKTLLGENFQGLFEIEDIAFFVSFARFLQESITVPLLHAVNPIRVFPFRRVEQKLLFTALVATLALIASSSLAAEENVGRYSMKAAPDASRHTEVCAMVGYSWGVNEIRLRDGDNYNLKPGKREVSLESTVIGLQLETSRSLDMGLRFQGWINIPERGRGDWLFESASKGWDTKSGYQMADLSLAYYLGLGGMPYSAALVGGYRYCRLDCRSTAVVNNAETTEDVMQVHIPYVGVYYGHKDFLGSEIRLDLRTSVLTIASLESAQYVGGSTRQVKGSSVTGFWFESLFSWNLTLSEKASAGLFANYTYVELSGGATVQKEFASTRFSMDSRSHLAIVGVTGFYHF